MAVVARLKLTDFRSYASAALAAGPGAVVITGDNGAGKTNILEALSFLVPGRGLRGAALSEAARSGGAGGWSLAASLATAAGDAELGTGTAAAAPERRIVRINGAAAAATALGEWLSIVWATPAMDRLFADTPAARRRFLDRLVLALAPGHGQHSLRYEAAMRQRTRLLTGDTPADPAWLMALEAAMAEHGEAIATARAALVAQLSDRLAAAPDGPFARPGLALAGGSAGPGFAAALAAGRMADAAAGRALTGPHRADLEVVHLGKGEPAARGSTGEQKAMLIAIILAHAELVADATGQPPLLLLDEVAAHLDTHRRAALFERLARMDTQVWMTGTDPALFAGVAGTWLRVEAGRIETA